MYKSEKSNKAERVYFVLQLKRAVHKMKDNEVAGQITHNQE